MENILPGLWGVPHIHPMLVHFPIALWTVATLLWIAALVLKNDDAWKFGRWLLYLGTISGLAALAAGFLAAEQMGHDAPGHGMVHTHRDFMIVATVLGVIVTIAAAVLRKNEAIAVKAGLLAGMVLTATVLTLGADRGAMMVFKHGIGTANEPMPDEASDGHGHEHGEEGKIEAGHGADAPEGHHDKGGDHHGDGKEAKVHKTEAHKVEAKAVEPAKAADEAPDAGEPDKADAARPIKGEAKDKPKPPATRTKSHDERPHKH